MITLKLSRTEAALVLGILLNYHPKLRRTYQIGIKKRLESILKRLEAAIEEEKCQPPPG